MKASFVPARLIVNKIKARWFKLAGHWWGTPKDPMGHPKE
jgi:hypothetical protein